MGAWHSWEVVVYEGSDLFLGKKRRAPCVLIYLSCLLCDVIWYERYERCVSSGGVWRGALQRQRGTRLADTQKTAEQGQVRAGQAHVNFKLNFLFMWLISLFVCGIYDIYDIYMNDIYHIYHIYDIYLSIWWNLFWRISQSPACVCLCR